MSGLGVRGDEPRQLIRHATDHRATPRHLEPAQQQVHEDAGQDVVNEESDVHHGGRRQNEAEKCCRVQNVPGAERAHIGHPAEDLGIPQRHVSQTPPPLGAPATEGQAGCDLVAERPGEPLPPQHRQAQDRDPQREDTGRDQRGATGLVNG